MVLTSLWLSSERLSSFSELSKALASECGKVSPTPVQAAFLTLKLNSLLAKHAQAAGRT